jgi:hypothetical protein
LGRLSRGLNPCSDGIGISYPVFRPDIWPSARTQIEDAFAGRASSIEDNKVLTRRHGKPENAYFTLSCSPVFDESGGVGGVLSHMFETTASILAMQAVESAGRFWHQKLPATNAGPL